MTALNFYFQGFKFQSDYFKSFNYLFGLGFKNCYLCKSLNKNYIYFEFDYNYSKEFITFHNQIQNRSNFVELFHKINKLYTYPCRNCFLCFLFPRILQ